MALDEVDVAEGIFSLPMSLYLDIHTVPSFSIDKIEPGIIERSTKPWNIKIVIGIMTGAVRVYLNIHQIRLFAPFMHHLTLGVHPIKDLFFLKLIFDELLPLLIA